MSRKKVKGLLDDMKENLRAGLENQYFNIALNRFKWTMPKEIPVRYPEKWLYNNGMCVFCRPPGLDYMVLPVATESIEYNVYGEPSSWHAVAMGALAGRINSLSLNADNSVLMYNDDSYSSPRAYISELIEQMVNVELTMRLNVNAQKNPLQFKSSDETALQNKNTFIEYFETEPVFFKTSMLSDEFEIFNSNILFIGKDLADVYNVYDSRIMGRLGINNMEIDKKERVNVAEAEGNNQKIEIMRASDRKQREIAVDKINELFDVGCAVEENIEYEDDYDGDEMPGTQPFDRNN